MYRWPAQVDIEWYHFQYIVNPKILRWWAQIRSYTFTETNLMPSSVKRLFLFIVSLKAILFKFYHRDIWSQLFSFVLRWEQRCSEFSLMLRVLHTCNRMRCIWWLGDLEVRWIYCNISRLCFIILSTRNWTTCTQHLSLLNANQDIWKIMRENSGRDLGTTLFCCLCFALIGGVPLAENYRI